ncbi:MAG: hypothetical protein QM490_01850 [Candidatus Gracilibacteria bacterium]
MNTDNTNNNPLNEMIEDNLNLSILEEDISKKFDINTSETDIDLEELDKAEQQFNDMFQTSKHIEIIVSSIEAKNEQVTAVQVNIFKRLLEESNSTKELINNISNKVNSLSEEQNSFINEVTSKLTLLEQNEEIGELKELIIGMDENKNEDKKAVIKTVIIFSILSSIISSSLIISFLKLFN